MPQELEACRSLRIRLDGAAHEELNQLASERKSTIPQLVLIALGLLRVMIHEGKMGNRFVIVEPNGKPLRELVLPELT